VVTSQTIPVFVNGRVFAAVPGTSLARLLADHEPTLLAAILDGATVTDARVLPVDPDAPVHAGAIYRVSARGRLSEATDA
jgi:hypothetical protein